MRIKYLRLCYVRLCPIQSVTLWSTRHDRIEIPDHDSSVERDQVLEDQFRLDRFRQLLWNDRGSDRGRIGCKAFRVARGCNGHFDAVAGERLGKSLADV